jgi:hypothetical protein
VIDQIVFAALNIFIKIYLMQQTQSDRSLRSHKPRGMKSPKLDKAENPENTQNSIKSITYKIPAKSISPEKDK